MECETSAELLYLALGAHAILQRPEKSHLCDFPPLDDAKSLPLEKLWQQGTPLAPGKARSSSKQNCQGNYGAY